MSDYTQILPRFRSRWASAVQLFAMICVLLQPLTVNSYWTDSNGDGVKEWVDDPAVGDSWWEADSDADQMTNAEEALFGSDPYRIDSDFDGLTDRDERDITPAFFGGLHTDPWLWSTNASGISDYDQFYQQLQSITPQVNYNTLIANNQTFYSFYDADGDGTNNPWDSDPLGFDMDGDGLLNWQDAYMNDFYNGDPPPPGGVNYEYNGVWYPGFWSDADGDSIPDPADPYPNGSYIWQGNEYAGSWIDTDGDGIPNSADAFPNGSFLWSGIEYGGSFLDTDGDGTPDVADNFPNGSFFWASVEYAGSFLDTDGDGTPDVADSSPNGSFWWNGIEYLGSFLDTDSDGTPDVADTFPYGSFIWAGIEYAGNFLDSDGDGTPNVADSFPFGSFTWAGIEYAGTFVDTDLDGTPDVADNFPNGSFLWQGIEYAGVFVDTDTDGTPDFADTFPNGSYWWAGTEYAGSMVDADDDGIPDFADLFPNGSFVWAGIEYAGSFVDNDGDGTPNVADLFPDVAGSYTWNGTSYPGYLTDNDSDSDGIPNDFDLFPNGGTYVYNGSEYLLPYVDSDGDNVPDPADEFPTTEPPHIWYLNHQYAGVWADADSDNIPDQFECLQVPDYTNDPLNGLDTDQDGLTDTDEIQRGTNRYFVDTDGDGLTDFEEVSVYNRNPLLSRTNADAGQVLTDFFDVQAITPGLVHDSDGDGIPDVVENWFGLNPHDGNDADGIISGGMDTNLDRYNLGVTLLTGSTIYDADDDGITDAMEDYYAAFYPGVLDKHRFADAVEDSDNDNLFNYEEVAAGLSPVNATTFLALPDLQQFQQKFPSAGAAVRGLPTDADADGMPDLWEHRYRLHLSLRNSADFSQNPDGDSHTNIREYQTWRNPLIADRQQGLASTGTVSTTDPFVNITAPTWTPPSISTLGGANLSGEHKIFEIGNVPPDFEEPPDDVVFLEANVIERNVINVQLSATGWFKTPRIKRTAKSVPQCSLSFTTPDPTGLGQSCNCQHGSPAFKSAEHLNDVGFPSGSYMWVLDMSVVSGGYCSAARNLPSDIEIQYRIRRNSHSNVEASETVNNTRKSFFESGTPFGFDTYKLYLDIPGGSDVMTKYSGSSGNLVYEPFCSITAYAIGNEEVQVFPQGSGEDGEDAKISVNDAAGPRYRKVGLNGVPISDSKPQVQNENGEDEEETYIDAFNAQLHHSVSDVYVTDESTLLPLMVRRDVTPDMWNDRYGLLPSERPNQPFGPGWSSNLTSYVRFDITDGKIAAEVVDEMGASQRYILFNGSWRHDGQEARDMKGYLNNFTATMSAWVPNVDLGVKLPSFSGITLAKKFGTTCTYQFVAPANLSQIYQQDRISHKGSYNYQLYARLTTVTDRLGNQLDYLYPTETDLEGSLIPSKIHDPNRPGHQILIRQSAGRVSEIRGPGGDLISYQYEADELKALASVTKYANTAGSLSPEVVNYGYDHFQELVPDDDDRPGINPILPVTYSNLEIESIRDERGAEYRFTHQKNRSIFTPKGPNRSVPMYLTSANSPIIGKVHVKVQVMNAQGIPAPADTPRLSYSSAYKNNASGVLVSFSAPTSPLASPPPDTDPHYVYRFTNPSQLARVGLSTELNSYTVGYKAMTITAPDGGVETYLYDGLTAIPSTTTTPAPAALPSASSMLLTKVINRDNKSTQFAYTDSVGTSVAGAAIYPFDDPTTETDSNGVTKIMTYHAATRQLASITVPRSATVNVTTEYAFDAKGRRESETVTSSNTAVTGGSKKVFVYDDATVNGSNEPIMTGFIKSQTLDTPGLRTGTAPSLTQVPIITTTRATAPKDSTPAWWRTISETVVMDGRDATTTTWHDFNGNKTMVRDPRGHVTKFEYDGRHRLTKVIHPDETTKSLKYDAHGNLVQETDEMGNRTFHEYDALNRRTKTTFDLNRNGQPDARYTTAVIATALHDTESPYDGDMVTETTYNRFNLPVTQTDARGIVTLFEYDELGRLIQTTVNATDSRPSAKQITRYIDSEPNTPDFVGGSVFDVSGFKPLRVYDPRGNRTEFKYDDLYRPIKVTRPDRSVVHTTYNLAGQVTSVSEPAADWDPTLTVRETEVPDGSPVLPKITGGVYITYTAYDALGLPTKVTYPDNKRVQSFSTPSGQVWKSIDETVAETNTYYNAAGLPVRVIQPKPISTSPNPEILTYYDLSGNPSHITDPRGNVTQQIYNERNRLVKTILPAVVDASSLTTTPINPVIETAYDAVGRVTSVTDPLGYTNRSFYDAAGRVIASFDALDQPTLSTYDAGGNVLTLTNALGQTTTNSYHALGHLLTTTDASDIVTQFGYDIVGNRTSVTDGKDQTTRFEYDAFNRLTLQTFANGDTRSSTYNAPPTPSSPPPSPPSSQPPTNYLDKATETDSMARTTTYTYDNRHRLLLKKEQSQSTAEQQNVYGTTGRLASATYYSQTTSYTYDKPGRTLTEQDGSLGRSNIYQYDLNGNRTTSEIGVKTTSGVTTKLRTTTTTYDALNRPEQILDDNGTAATTDDLTTRYGYDLAGRAFELKSPNGVIARNSYDGSGRLTHRKLYGSASQLSAGVPLATFVWTHDAIGNVKTQTEIWLASGNQAARERSTLMTYDDSNRLDTETITDAGLAPVTTTYTYDDANNRHTKAVALGAGTAPPGLETGHWTYIYNLANQLTAQEKRTIAGGNVIGGANYT
ncbi:MAG: hypothetical protein ABL974_06110, partial [Prosthecobacter sp.]